MPRRVEAVFSEEEAALDELIPAAGIQSNEAEGTPIAVKELKKAGVGAKAMGAVRASYSGAVLTGFVTGVLGLTLAAPVALAAGAAVGYRGIREDSKRQLAQRQALAKAAMRQYVDDVASRALERDTRHRPAYAASVARSLHRAGRRAAPLCRGLARRGEEGGGAR